MIVELSKLESLIVAAHHALPEDCRSAAATPDEIAAFESDYGTIPPSFRGTWSTVVAAS